MVKRAGDQQAWKPDNIFTSANTRTILGRFWLLGPKSSISDLYIDNKHEIAYSVHIPTQSLTIKMVSC